MYSSNAMSWRYVCSFPSRMPTAMKRSGPNRLARVAGTDVQVHGHVEMDQCPLGLVGGSRFRHDNVVDKYVLMEHPARFGIGNGEPRMA